MASTRNQRSQWGLLLLSQRQKAQLDQVTLAACIGVSQGTVSRWERGVMAPKPAMQVTVARALGLQVEDIFPD